jgi:hypothetical protein
MRVFGVPRRLNSLQNDERAKTGNTGGAQTEVSDRKHLTLREVERLLESTKVGTIKWTWKAACCMSPG